MIESMSRAVSTITSRSAAGFEVGTVAWVTRNGVTAYCTGPSCTWHDDPQIEQTLILPIGVRGGVDRYSCQYGDATDPLPHDTRLTRVTTETFREIVAKVGGQYDRRNIR